MLIESTFDFHTSNIQRREQSDSHGLSCAWETQFYGCPKGVFDHGNETTKTQQNEMLFCA